MGPVVADDDSEVQTALNNYQAENTPPGGPGSQIAKPSTFRPSHSRRDIFRSRPNLWSQRRQEDILKAYEVQYDRRFKT